MKRILCAALALCLALTGCSSMLNHDYTSIQPHSGRAPAEENSSALTARSYQELVNDISYLVSQGIAHGVIHLTNYAPRTDAESDLDAACLEVVQEDPLGSYAVGYIKPELTYIVSYYEANIYLSYRRTQEQVKSVVAVTGSSAIREKLQDTLKRFSPEAVLRVSYFGENEDYIRNLVQQAYYDTPLAAMGMPEVHVTIYPSPQAQQSSARGVRIVEILLTYPGEQEALRKKSSDLAAQADALSASFSAVKPGNEPRAIFDLLRKATQYMPGADQGRNTAYSALVDGSADSEGIALAFQLLCKKAGLESTVVMGQRAGSPWFWNIVALPGGEYRHMDATREDGFSLQDAELLAQEYIWARGDYPACTSAAQAAG